MSEVEALCDRIAILRAGKIVFLGTTGTLTEHLQGVKRLRVRFSPPLRADALPMRTCEAEEQGCLICEVPNLTDGLFAIAAAARQHGVSLEDIQVERASLERRFMDMVREGT
jgi:ABC-2 type transport system ATP-binding protein